MSYLYKYRTINQRAIQFIEEPELYFAKPTSFNDPFEIGADLINTAETKEILVHFEEYMAVLQEERKFELKLALRQHTRYLEDPIFEKEKYYLRRRSRLRIFDDRISWASTAINNLKRCSNKDARDTLRDFYESIREQLKMSAICCLCRNGTSNPMWANYADESRGISIELIDNNNLFKKKLIERYSVNYCESGAIDPVKLGYRKAYSLFHTTKTIEWTHEKEERFFIFGEPRSIKISSNSINAIVLGSRAISGEGLTGDRLDSHIELLKLFLYSLLRNRINIKLSQKSSSMKFQNNYISGEEILKQL